MQRVVRSHLDSKRLTLPLLALCAGVATLGHAQAAPLTTAAPEIFAPGIISGPASDGAPTFTPDSKTLYFERTGGSWGFILESHLRNGRWSQPTIASFSGLWSDSQPALSPDGSRLVFVSWRPTVPTTGMSADAIKALPRAAAMWEVRRTPGGWSDPVRLAETVNISPRVFKPSIAGNGNLYFMAKTDSAPTFRLYRSEYRNNTYLKAEPLDFSDGNHTDVDPGVGPDESFLIFSSAGRAGPDDTHEHLYITFRSGAGWGSIQPLRYAGDYEKNPTDDGEAQLGRDNRTLYFTSGRASPIHADRTRAQAAEDFARLNLWDNGNSNVWTISLAPWLDAARS